MIVTLVVDASPRSLRSDSNTRNFKATRNEHSVRRCTAISADDPGSICDLCLCGCEGIAIFSHALCQKCLPQQSRIHLSCAKLLQKVWGQQMNCSVCGLPWNDLSEFDNNLEAMHIGAAGTKRNCSDIGEPKPKSAWPHPFQ